MLLSTISFIKLEQDLIRNKHNSDYKFLYPLKNGYKNGFML
jgi:hypothetical protein